MTETARDFWENFYGAGPVWSGRPNELLVREIADVAPGTALDLGCAEGADAVWLAARGWTVTAVDVSTSALSRAREHAREAGVDQRITWQEHDLVGSFPAGAFDLVSAQYLHSPVAPPEERTTILRRAAEATAPGGILLIVGHAGYPDFMTEPPAHGVVLPSTAEVLAGLALPAAEWTVEVDETLAREAVGHHGETGTRHDNVLRLRRRG